MKADKWLYITDPSNQSAGREITSYLTLEESYPKIPLLTKYHRGKNNQTYLLHKAVIFVVCVAAGTRIYKKNDQDIRHPA
jgi:hypothetical protein